MEEEGGYDFRVRVGSVPAREGALELLKLGRDDGLESLVESALNWKTSVLRTPLSVERSWRNPTWTASTIITSRSFPFIPPALYHMRPILGGKDRCRRGRGGAGSRRGRGGVGVVGGRRRSGPGDRSAAHLRPAPMTMPRL